MPSFTQATRSDYGTILAFMRVFYQGENLNFTPEVIAAMDQLLDDDSLGTITLIHSDTGTAGYFVLTYGYSLERGGRIALLDELFIVPHAHGQGLGKAAIAVAAELSRTANCLSLHLEVEQKNEAGRRLYRAAGFIQLNRYYLELPLTSPTPAPPQK